MHDKTAPNFPAPTMLNTHMPLSVSRPFQYSQDVFIEGVKILLTGFFILDQGQEVSGQLDLISNFLGKIFAGLDSKSRPQSLGKTRR